MKPPGRAPSREEEEAARRLEEAWNTLHATWHAFRHAPREETLHLERALDTAAHRIEDAGAALERAARVRTGSR
ncbi:MAG TPA: hypothetical protein VM889_13565 [Candidatus Thermoplasmatota archaeon]|nr:hypothetical protein [Candidatus Thermoplasmatota archaeon]